ncbi:cytochrome P450 [Astrocystis sublimbata]|nr:cytochrome P450 [Astrocystis sublimbata]
MASTWIGQRLSTTSTGELVTACLAPLCLYAAWKCIYNIYLHPAASFPGPRLAAVSNVWYAYHWATGRYPWAVQNALKQYGDVVRVAPNELVFITPQAFTDIYEPQTGGLEHFPKTNFMDLGVGDNALLWEMDPVKHHTYAKKVAPAFSARAIKEKEVTVNKYIEAFIQRMKEIGDQDEGIELKTWTDWVAMDTSADLAYSREMNQIRDMKSSPFLHELWITSSFVTANQIFKKFPFLNLAKYLFVPPTLVFSFFRIQRLNWEAIHSRIFRRGNIEQLDHFEQLLPGDAEEPTAQEKVRIMAIVGHLVIAGYEPVASQMFGTLMFSLLAPEGLRILVDEIRGAFGSYEEINGDTVADLPYLHASLMETLRITVLSSNGMPRLCPGATIDGKYVAKGIEVQYGMLAFTRDARYFHDGKNYHPQRWLSEGHPHWDAAFKSDMRKAFRPFSLGPRSCPGKLLAWRQTKLFITKVLWKLDVEMLPGQNIVFDRDFRMYGMWKKPNFRVRFRSHE